MLEKIDEYRWMIPQTYKKGMHVPGIIYSSERLIADIMKDKSVEQVANVACLPGIIKASMAMPDIHWGYGFPIGGVGATDVEAGGVISPGGVGYDINCGVRMIRTTLTLDEIKGHVQPLMQQLFRDIPAGVGESGMLRLSEQEEKQMFLKGTQWAIKHGYGDEVDREYTEEKGCIPGADPEAVSATALKRGRDQLGTLGSGNHFLELQVVDKIFDESTAAVFGLACGQIVFMIHCGSRGFGHQICDEYIQIMHRSLAKYGIVLEDRQLVCAPVNSPEGQSYLGAMRAAANYAWANRQVLMHILRQVCERFFKRSWQDLGMNLIYDVAHNIAKIEYHEVAGKKVRLCVHRKGATRAFGPGSDDIPSRFSAIGQPVIIPGDMGRASYLLVGTAKAIEETFGSTCHGAGRVMSRHEAIQSAEGRSIRKELEQKGIIALAHGRTGLAEEQPDAYKDVNEVVDVVQGAGISKKVCRMRPLGVIKG